jgi:hypothetical protein
MYIKSASRWRGKVEPCCSIAIYVDKKHVRVPKGMHATHDPNFEFYITGCFAEIPPFYLSKRPVREPIAKVDFTDPNALDHFYKLIKRAVGKLLNPEEYRGVQ